MIIAAIIALPTAAPAADLVGRAIVVDGGTLQIESVKQCIRLYGVDGPKSYQTCDDASG